MEKLYKLCNSIFYYISYFYIYSFAGWIIETVYVSIKEHKLASRGFLYGPLCPVYGFGFLLVLVLLKTINKNMFFTFFGAVTITTLLEYFTGFILESVFESRLWDYSEEIYNIKGRISLVTSLAWGFASLLFLRFIHPKVNAFVDMIPQKYRVYIAYLALFYMVIDLTLSTAAILGLKILLPIFSLFFTF